MLIDGSQGPGPIDFSVTLTPLAESRFPFHVDPSELQRQINKFKKGGNFEKNRRELSEFKLIQTGAPLFTETLPALMARVEAPWVQCDGTHGSYVAEHLSGEQEFEVRLVIFSDAVLNSASLIESDQ